MFTCFVSVFLFASVYRCVCLFICLPFMLFFRFASSLCQLTCCVCMPLCAFISEFLNRSVSVLVSVSLRLSASVSQCVCICPCLSVDVYTWYFTVQPDRAICSQRRREPTHALGCCVGCFCSAGCGAVRISRASPWPRVILFSSRSQHRGVVPTDAC